MKRKGRGTVKGLRRGLLALLLLVVAGLIGLYLLGRLGRPGDSPEPAPVDTATAAETAAANAENVVASSAAFDFTQSMEGKRVFAVHGDRFRSTREGKVELEKVRFEVFRDDVSYSVSSNAATYDSNSQDALLSGDVHLAGGELSIASGQLQLGRGGKFISAEGPVALRHGEFWTGAAASLEFDIALDLLTLRGPVTIAGRLPGAEPIDVSAGKIVLDRSGRVLSAKGEVTANRGASHFVADTADVYLAEDGSTPSALALEGDLSGTWVDATALPGDGRVDFQGIKLTMQLGASGFSEPKEIALEGRPGRLALVESVKGDLIDGLASRALTMTFADGRPQSAQSNEPVYFSETRAGTDQPTRSARADRAEAAFGPDGSVQRVALNGGVTMTDPALRGWGDQAIFDFALERSELLGAPARTESASGDLSSPHIVYSRKTGLLDADRGVRGVLKRGSAPAASTIAGVGFRSDQPIEFQADEAVFSESPRGFLLKGKARAWQGKSLLLADQIHGEETEERLAAAGNVRTLLALPQGKSTAAPAASTAGAAEKGAPEIRAPAAATPVAPLVTVATAATAPMTEVLADLLTYRRKESTLTYSGTVRLSQTTRTLACDEIVADLDEKQQVRRMTGTGKVLLRDAAAGRSIQATVATYDVAADSIELTGEPVTIQDDTGAKLTGKRAIYDLKTGAARLAGAAGAAGATDTAGPENAPTSSGAAAPAIAPPAPANTPKPSTTAAVSPP
ncbi:MAG: LptA/OstA family protein [Thermoanaerobaculia bacterium]